MDSVGTDCLFCRIVAGTQQAVRVFEDAHAVAFLDHRPVFKGHVLVIPPRHIETLVDLPANELAPFFATVQRLARAAEDGLGAHGTFVAMNNRISQSVPHLHAHVVPRHRKDGLRGFFWPRVSYAAEEAETFATRLRAALEAPG